MNQHQAEKFVRDLMDIWENFQFSKLNNFYSKKVIGYYHGQTFDFENIKNRMQYVKSRYPKQKHYVEEVVLINPNLIVARLRQTGLDKLHKTPYAINLTAVWQLKNDLAVKLWLMPEGSFDYFATSDDLAAAKENITVDSSDRKHFNGKLKVFNDFYKGETAKLTPREQDCLYYFLNGYSAKEIGKLLKITHRTVQDHLAKVKAKYGCSSKHQLRQKLFPAQ